MEELAGDAFMRTGSLRIAADDDEATELRREYEALCGDGFAAEWIDGLSTGRRRYPAALLHPPDAALQPGRWVRRLAAMAAEAGAEIREQNSVGTLDELDAEHVVVATDGYPSGLLGDFEGAIIPTRGQMIATEPLAERLFSRPHYARNGFDYWQQTPDGCILAGGFRDVSLLSELTTEEVTTDVIQAALEAFVNELAERPLRVTHRWAGLFGLVPDFLPVVGRVPGYERVWIAGGYSGHGNVLGLACGDLVARAVLGERQPLLDLFDPSRAQATPAG
jgi:glycine/D-amino acid oxidase-like deaminating enzyme